MKPMTDAHHSGRYDATDDQWEDAISELTEADVWSVTEAAGLDVSGLATFFRAGDALVGWNRHRFRRAGWFPTTLTTKDWSPGGKIRRTGVEMPWVLLEEEGGARLLRGAFHLPSSIQGGSGWSNKPEDRDNIEAARDCLRNLHRQTSLILRMLEPAEITLAADWNVDLAVDEWEDRINSFLDDVPQLKMVVPSAGTHGKRRIDGHATTLPVRGRGVGERMPGFDHVRESIITKRS